MNAVAGDQLPAPDPALADFLLLNEEIAAIVKARLPLEDHLRLVGAELPKTAGALAGRIAQRLSEGKTLPNAIEAECASLPAVYRAVVIAGLKSGRLNSAIESLVDTATRCDQLRRTTAIALLYPLVLTLIASFAFALIVTQVVPKFDWLRQSHFKLAGTIAQYPQWVKLGAALVPVALAFIFLRWWHQSGRVSHTAFGRFSLLGLLPGAGRVRFWSQVATFADLLHLLVESNLPLNTALQLAAEAAGSGPLQRSGLALAKSVERGEISSKSEANQSITEADAMPMLIRVALQDADNRPLLIGSLRQAATLYRERASRAAEWYSEFVPILLTVGLAGSLTAGFTLFVLWPYSSMLHELAGAHWR